MGKYAIGLDYGTLSVRALLLNIDTGKESAAAVYEYPHGIMTKGHDTWALQDPKDYLEGMQETIKAVMEQSNVLSEEIVGIGIDVTASTILPVCGGKTPLCF